MVYDMLPETDLHAVDIRDTLNANGGSVTNKLTSFFSTDANINRWSFYKPIVTGYVGDYFLDLDDEKWNNQQGTSPTAISDLQAAFAGSTEDEWFPYTPPRGVKNGYNEPMRLGDFRLYRADATSPFNGFTILENPNPTHIDDTVFDIYVRFKINDRTDYDTVGGMMALEDWGIMDDTWNTIQVGVIDYHKDRNEYKLWKSGRTISSSSVNWGHDTVTVDWGGSSSNTNNTDTVDCVGEHEVAAVLVKDDGNIYPLPFKHLTVNVVTWYGSSQVIDYGGSCAITSNPDSTTGRRTGVLDLWMKWVRGGTDTADTEFTAEFSWGQEGSYQSPTHTQTFTIPDSDDGNQPTKTVRYTINVEDSNLYDTIISLYDAGTLQGNCNSHWFDLVN